MNIIFYTIGIIYFLVGAWSGIRFYLDKHPAAQFASERICKTSVFCMAAALIVFINGPTVLRTVLMAAMLLWFLFQCVKELCYSCAITAALALVANSIDIDAKYEVIADFYYRVLRYMSLEHQELFNQEVLYYMVED